MRVPQWHDEVYQHVSGQIGSSLSRFDGVDALFWNDAPEEVTTPFAIIDDPEIEQTVISDGYLEDVEFTIRYYVARESVNITNALDVMNGLTGYFSNQTQPTPMADGGELYSTELNEIPSDKPDEYALELTVTSMIRT